MCVVEIHNESTLEASSKYIPYIVTFLGLNRHFTIDLESIKVYLGDYFTSFGIKDSLNELET